MDKYFKIQRLVELQKERKDTLEKVFLEVLNFSPKLEIDFRFEEKMDYENSFLENRDVAMLIKVKVKDKSSVRFVVDKNKQKILEEYSKIFVKDILTIG